MAYRPISGMSECWPVLRWPASVAGLVVAAACQVLIMTAAGAQPLTGGSSHIRPPALYQTVAVFGSDDRTVIPRERQRLKAGIGLLFSSKARTLCSAFCVADDVVATAAHCLFRTAGDPPPRLEDFRFSRVKDDARQQARLAGFANRSSLQNVVSGSLSLSVRPPIDATRDWALARLAAPVCRGYALELAPMGQAEVAKAAASGRLFLAGYHRDFSNWHVALSRGCEVKDLEEGVESQSFQRDFLDPDRLILHTCDTGGASSGSPLLVDTPAGPAVVGINVGTYVQSKVMMQNGEVVHRFKANEIANTAAGIAAAAEALPRLRTAEILASGAQILALQRQMSARGWYAGPADGVHGVNLRVAIEDLERRERLPVTGLPTAALLERLGGGAVSTRLAEGRGRTTGRLQRRAH